MSRQRLHSPSRLYSPREAQHLNLLTEWRKVSTFAWARNCIQHSSAADPASYPHTSGDYNLMMSGGENGSQEGGSTGPSVHEGIQDRSHTTGAECWLLGSQPKARNAGVELI